MPIQFVLAGLKILVVMQYDGRLAQGQFFHPCVSRTDRRYKMLYICPSCSYRYDDDFEMDPFDKLPEDWCCPVCKAAKISFRGIRIDHNEGDG